MAELAILLGLHHGSLSSHHVVRIHLLHLGHVHLRVVAMEHRALASKVGHGHGILHGSSRSGCSWVRRHAGSHGTTLSDLRARHGRMHSSHHTRVWLTHVAVLNLHGVTVGHTWMARTHARLSGIRTCLHHIRDG